MSPDHSGDLQLEPDGGPPPGASALGLQLVFPELRPDPVTSGGVPLVLGRDGDGEGRLSGNEISRRHAELRASGGQLILRDLDSRNGLFVNGERCAQACLALGDVVRMGEWVGVAVALERGPVLEADPSGFSDSLHLGSIGRPAALRAGRVARTALPLVLEGEKGTGKERFARAIHEWSERAGAFVVIECAALPDPSPDLLPDELPGSGEAQGGTLYLDGVGDLPPPLQARLLRGLEQDRTDVRILAATQVPLALAVAAGRLRPELQARLERSTIRLPPLRERRADVPTLFLHLLAQNGLIAPELSTRLVEALCGYDWPLNVRELDHLAQQLSLLHGDAPVFRRSHLPDRIRWFGASAPGADGPPAPDEPGSDEPAPEVPDPGPPPRRSEATATGKDLPPG